MNRQRRTSIIVLLLFVSVPFIIFVGVNAGKYLSPGHSRENQEHNIDSKQEIKTNPSHSDGEINRIKTANRVKAIFNHPIAFYGRVIDQNGEPVSGAVVGYKPVTGLLESNSYYENQSDEQGYFSIKGIKGAGLSVGVMKDGYYRIDGKSSMTFGYGMGPDSYRRVPPTKQNPAIFELYKAGRMEALHSGSRNFIIPRNGTPVGVDLQTLRRAPWGTADIEVQAWTDDAEADLAEHYDWKCRISVPNGGLIERKGEFDFIAPEVGYRGFDKMGSSKGDESWTNNARREYFVSLPDGRYALVVFVMRAGGDHFFQIECHLNPSGSRNLEFDPAKSLLAP